MGLAIQSLEESFELASLNCIRDAEKNKRLSLAQPNSKDKEQSEIQRVSREGFKETVISSCTKEEGL